MVKKSPIELGKEFEGVAYSFLKTLYPKVIWRSRDNFHSVGDFECFDTNGNNFIFDAKRGKVGMNNVNRGVDKIITQDSSGNIMIVDASKYWRPIHTTRLQADIPERLNKKLKITKIIEGHKNIQESLIFVLGKFFEDKYDA